MDTKEALKKLKLNESTISMVLGALVIIVVGFILVNYFKSSGTQNQLPDDTETSDETQLPATYQVKAGDDLWKISEQFYGSGYNWVDIAAENEITNPNLIEEGQTLQIPNVEPKLTGEQLAQEITQGPTEAPTQQPTVARATNTPTLAPEVTRVPLPTVSDGEEGTTITGSAYTVVRGDTLWDIAERAYGSGYKWVDIARANDLVNPNLIHPGNQFTLPR